MSTRHELRYAGNRRSEVDAAAEELARRLKDLADTTSAKRRAKRIHYGHRRVGHALKRRSPAGFLLDQNNLQMLLPDGRLWSYNRSDAQRFPGGRYYDVRTDHDAYAAGRSYPGGTEFTFLGAVIGKYTFGYAAGDGSLGPHGLCAIVSEGGSVHYVEPDQVFSELETTLATAGRD